MFKRTLRIKSALTFVLAISLLCSGSFARGDDHWGGRRGNERGDRREGHWNDGHGDRYRYHDGGWYRSGWFGWEFAVAALAIGTMVELLPPNHTTVIVGETPYYYDGRVYYKQLPDNIYVVVQPPVVVSPQAQPADVLTINVPNARGGYTAVSLRRSGTGYVGPQGEYYTDVPSVDHLKALYGQ